MTDHPSEQVDRVAEAMCAVGHPDEVAWEMEHNGQVWRRLARAALDAATPPRLDAADIRDAVGDHYDHAPYVKGEWPAGPNFPLWHDDRLIEAFDWEGIARTLNDDLSPVGSVGERDQP
jgi:hypothetical protein